MTSLPLIEWSQPKQGAQAEALHHEWLVTNGLGGYASGTIALCNTRKYHGLFVPSLPGFGRTVMLARVDDRVVVGGRELELCGAEHPGGELHLPVLNWLERFTLRGLVPEWKLSVGGVELYKRIVFVHNESTVYVVYSHVRGPKVSLKLRPFPCFRPHDLAPHDDLQHHAVQIEEHGVSIALNEKAPPLKLRMESRCAQPFVAMTERTRKLLYRVEVERGLPATEVLSSPGWFECDVEPGESVALCISLQGWDTLSRRPEDVIAWELEREQKLLERAKRASHGDGTQTRLALAADQFIIAPKHRPPDTAWSHATGQDLRSVIAGYPWFTDWGRDTMISLEGLTLCTGRTREAAAILRTFQHHVRDGLVPNYFPEGEQQGVYHTADATLWFFHAVEQYLKHTSDLSMLRDLWATLVDIVAKHLEGTRFGIGVDRDGLLKQGQGGYQLTWMDAKVDDWVVTPRRGKAVELSALWFNALKLMEQWSAITGADASYYAAHAERTRASFNARFWNEAAGCLYDVVDGEGGDDANIRPNQVFAISLSHPVLDEARWGQVLSVVRRELLTPFGLRTLSPQARDFKATYFGDLRSRDAAYHQGTVWPWLLGHYVDALLKASNDTGEAMQALAGLVEHVKHACMGSISEIFDAVPPYLPRGCSAQAWSVAEALRIWLKVASLHGERQPMMRSA